MPAAATSELGDEDEEDEVAESDAEADSGL